MWIDFLFLKLINFIFFCNINVINIFNVFYCFINVFYIKSVFKEWFLNEFFYNVLRKKRFVLSYYLIYLLGIVDNKMRLFMVMWWNEC